jgi:hypothetical protein
MKPRPARRVRGWQLLLLTLAWLPANQATADAPPPPSIQGPIPAVPPARPAAGQVVLYDQINSADASRTSSQDAIVQNQFDTRAADDFIATSGLNSWQITAIEVVGFYGGGVGPTVNTVNVEFYADSTSRPGQPLATASSVPVSGTASSGNFFLPLNPPVGLGANANYWVSVQAIQADASSPFWYWNQRTPQSLAPAVWKNPNNGFNRSCIDWTAITTCYPNTGRDLLFRLYGTESTAQVTPILISLSPNHAANRTFTLIANGAGFANGAVLNWTIGGTQQFATTVANASRLSTLIPASAVSSFGATVSVSVTNPGPCAGSCTSNTLSFFVSNPIYLPAARR